MPSISFLDQLYKEHQTPDILYLQESNIPPEGWEEEWE